MKYSILAAATTLASTVSASFIPRDFNHTALQKRLQSLSYSLSFESRGSSFFNGWVHDGPGDPTNGLVNYLTDRNQATSLGLMGVNSAGNAFMKVDSTSNLGYGVKRNSIRIHTSQSFARPSLIILDAVHLPFGCSVWPAFWSYGMAAAWPQLGEIDIVEQVHNSGYNQATLHTTAGCTQSGSPLTGSVLATNCDWTVNGNAGCSIKDNTANSYGQSASNVGGGVWAVLYDDTGVYYWHFPRGSIPSDISVGNTTPHPANWGTPVGVWSSSTCPTSFIGAQNLIFDITLCGDWAGATFSSAGCGSDCTAFVQTGSNFVNAYWEVGYVRVFSGSGSGGGGGTNSHFVDLTPF
ncbi:glycoside hydrolase family 16 protein [Atractiella rhizophila]|nr:glycoside hydrolase family 16 protein [Atractiella rhizophila]